MVGSGWRENNSSTDPSTDLAARMGVVQGAGSAHAAASGLKEHKPAPFH